MIENRRPDGQRAHGVVAIALSLALAACASQDAGGFAPPNGMPHLEAASARAIGLGYGESATLSARYTDGNGRPVSGVIVRFSFAAAAGATLSRDRAVTASDGVASVVLTAGNGEASFRVIASADGVADLGFDVAVSKFPFVSLDARIAYAGAGMGRVAHVDALVYDSRACAELPPSTTPPNALRQLGADSASATLRFPSLRATAYALVGRALDGSGRLVAWGCVDVQASPQAAGTLTVPIPLEPVLPSPAGTFRVALTLPLPPGQLPAWESLAACPAGLAQQILDGMVTSLGPGPLSDGIARSRAAADADGCRPTSNGGATTLDGAVATLLVTNNARAADFSSALADLRAITASAAITSELRVVESGLDAAASGGTWLATHELQRVAFAGVNGAHPVAYDPRALGLPVTIADNVTVTSSDGAVRLAPHQFTLRLPALWGRAAVDVALAPRKLPADPRALLAYVVEGATAGTNSDLRAGCLAVESVVGDRIAALPGNLAPACEQALDAIAPELRAAFTPPDRADLTLEGAGVPSDDDGDLRVETISGNLLGSVIAGGGRTESTMLPFRATRAN